MGAQLGPGASVHVLDKKKELLLLPGNKYRIGQPTSSSDLL